MTDGARRPSLAVRMAKSADWIVAFRIASRLLGIVNTITLVRVLRKPAIGGVFGQRA